ncbi:helix-hairpin-helix domain-containing protein [Dactylosporangium sp. CA-052675]|uniref:helix-hairpin-helix domain-containing protein n=1 Tax=Dactylosporangium sp. CA-052675 TaxID=3239927 RepID=UPI003D8A0821
MVWYTNQSLLLILLAFLLGLLVGYLWWGLRLRRVRSSESATESTTAAPVAPVAAPASAPVAAPASAAPIAAAVAAAEPIAEPAPAPEPVAVVEDEPVAVVEDEPVAVVEDEPVAVVEKEPVDADLVADVESAFAAEPVEAVEAVEPVEAVESAGEPARDELERIEGIGPKIAAALRAAGITTYAQLADAERSTVELALERANLRFAPSLGTWSRQARLLADGDETGFKELTDRLIAGREVAAKAAAESAPLADVEPELEPVAVEPEPEREPVVVAVEPEPEPAVVEPVAVEPEPVAVEPEPVAVEPEPVAVEPEPVAVEPEPVALEPEPEPEPVVEEPVAEAPEPVVEAPEPVVEAPEPVVVPAQAVAAEDVKPDNLKRIEGIGPKMSAALIASGIKTYQQLADADVDTLRAAIEAAGLRFAPSIVTWSRQARHLADGDEEGFADLTRRLVAGRDTGRA